MKTQHTFIGGANRRGGTTATIALALIVLLCLMAAYIFIVHPRSENTSRIEASKEQVAEVKKARQQGALVIDQVRTNGLNTYIGPGYLNYYLLKSNGESTGFMVDALKLVTDPDNGSQSYVGLNFRYYIKPVMMERDPFVVAGGKFQIANDLSQYLYTRFRSDPCEPTPKREAVFNWSKGVLVGPYAPEDKSGFKQNRALNQKNLIPITLLDFFSSLAAQDETTESAFLMVAMTITPQPSLMPMECLVQGGQGEIPQAIVDKFPQGRPTICLWGNQPPQSLYYSPDHQLLWQRDMLPDMTDETIEITTRDELLLLDPKVEKVLTYWLAPYEDLEPQYADEEAVVF